jgi:zinc D-Ala-D-Ala carboxypeptidase
MNLSPNFTLEELIFSETAIRKGIDNTPTKDIVQNLTSLSEVLEQIRSLLGDNPLKVSSGYRCLILNKAIGGSKTSAHMDGRAADFTCSNFGTPFDIAVTISGSDIQFDQVIQEGTWVHIGIARDGEVPRREILTAHFVNGKVYYTTGLA